MTNHRIHHFSDGSTKVAKRLVAHRHTMTPKAWCLSWDFGGTSVGAEGECSRKLFRTAAEAKAWGLRVYGERAVAVRNW
jgi:hypothetical protein